MSHLVSLAAPITGAHTVKQYAGFGILGADIPTTGSDGGSVVLNDSIDSTKEYHWRVTSSPSAGTLTIYPDMSSVFTSAPDGTYTWTYRLFENGLDQGTATVSLLVGVSTPVSSIAGVSANSTPAFAASSNPISSIAAVSSSPIAVLSAGVGQSTSFVVASENSIALLAANVQPITSISATSGSSLFNGSAAISQPSTISATSGDSSSDFRMLVRPVSSVAATSAVSVFSGSAGVGNGLALTVVSEASIAAFDAYVTAHANCTASSDSSTASYDMAIGGSIYWPLPSQVLAGVSYGPTGAEYLGTATGGSGPSAESIAAAVLAALNATTIPVDTRKMNGANVVGNGTIGDKWRG